LTAQTKTTFAALGAVIALAVAAPVAQARHGGSDDRAVELRHGADDRAQKQDDRRARRAREAELRHGADDGAGHKRGGRDDGTNHG
jgi:hypothetical protein